MFIDYLGICWRTFSHHPVTSNTSRSALDWLSYILATVALISFQIELFYMLWKCNHPALLNLIREEKKAKIEAAKNSSNQAAKEKAKDYKTILNRNLSEIYFDGLDPESVEKSWFVRNFNFLYLMRLYLFSVLIFSMQYLPIVQVVASLVLLVAFTGVTLHYHSKMGLFGGSFVSVVRVIQEVSMCCMMGLINLFCLDSFYWLFSSNMKSIFVLIFTAFVVTNIAMEVGAVFVSIFWLFIKPPERITPLKKERPSGVIQTRQMKNEEVTNFTENASPSHRKLIDPEEGAGGRMESEIKPIFAEADIEKNQNNEATEKQEEDKEHKLVKGNSQEFQKEAENSQKLDTNLAISLSPRSKQDPAKAKEGQAAKEKEANAPRRWAQSPLNRARSFRKFRFNTKLSGAPNMKIKRSSEAQVQRKQPRSTTQFNGEHKEQPMPEKRLKRAFSFSKLERVKETEEERRKKNKPKLMQKKKSGFSIQPRRLF